MRVQLVQTMLTCELGTYEGHTYYLNSEGVRGRFIMMRFPSGRSNILCVDSKETIEWVCRFHPKLVYMLTKDIESRGDCMCPLVCRTSTLGKNTELWIEEREG